MIIINIYRTCLFEWFLNKESKLLFKKSFRLAYLVYFDIYLDSVNILWFIRKIFMPVCQCQLVNSKKTSQCNNMFFFSMYTKKYSNKNKQKIFEGLDKKKSEQWPKRMKRTIHHDIFGFIIMKVVSWLGWHIYHHYNHDGWTWWWWMSFSINHI